MENVLALFFTCTSIFVTESKIIDMLVEIEFNLAILYNIREPHKGKYYYAIEKL